MARYFIHKTLYGLLVLWGVVTAVFFLFNLSPGDPVRNLLGENASEEMVRDMRRKFDLDLPAGQRYLLYLNNLSPISVHRCNEPQSRIYLDPYRYRAAKLFNMGAHCVVLKWPWLGRAYHSSRSVSQLLGEVMGGTFVLATLSIGMALVLGLFMGIWAALHKDSAYDRLILVCSALGMSGPSFFVAILVAWLGAVVWYEHISLPLWPMVIVIAGIVLSLLATYGPLRKVPIAPAKWLWWSLALGAVWCVALFFLPGVAWMHIQLRLPGTRLPMSGSLYAVDVWRGKYLEPRHLILPVITLLIRPLAVIVQLTRSSMLDVMTQDYIRTTRAKGLGTAAIVWRHALRNALNPVITAVSGWFASLLAGAVFVEFVFGWKGLGQEMFAAIERHDLPIVMGGVLVIAAVFVLVNLLTDLLYAWVDPRLRQQ